MASGSAAGYLETIALRTGAEVRTAESAYKSMVGVTTELKLGAETLKLIGSIVAATHIFAWLQSTVAPGPDAKKSLYRLLSPSRTNFTSYVCGSHREFWRTRPVSRLSGVAAQIR